MPVTVPGIWGPGVFFGSVTFQNGLVMAMVEGYVLHMAQANISELKNRLSYYLNRVRRGESVLVLDRDRVIARIEPAGRSTSEPTEDSRWLDDLERRGVVRRGSGKLPREWLARRPKLKADLVRALLDEREGGR